MTYPLNISASVNLNYNSLENQSELSEKDRTAAENFMKIFTEQVSFETCKQWSKKADAFSISDFGIFEDAGKKYFCASVKAYFNDPEARGRITLIENTEITVLHNILLFDYDTYEECGWVF